MVGRRVTEAEYLSMPDVKPYLEYCDGVLVQKAMPNRDHFRLAHRLDFALGICSLEHGGEAGPEPRVRFAFEGRVFHRLPDVAYWAPEKPVGPVQSMLPPTLSPGDTLASEHLPGFALDLAELFTALER
jgi:Uma2 family endonuclease